MTMFQVSDENPTHIWVRQVFRGHSSQVDYLSKPHSVETSRKLTGNGVYIYHFSEIDILSIERITINLGYQIVILLEDELKLV